MFEENNFTSQLLKRIGKNLEYHEKLIKNIYYNFSFSSRLY